MLTYTFLHTYDEFLRDKKVEEYIWGELKDALIQSDFSAEEVEIRFADRSLLHIAIHYFNYLACHMQYITQIMRETEVYVWGIDGTKTRYTFMNSIPETKNGT